MSELFLGLQNNAPNMTAFMISSVIADMSLGRQACKSFT